MCNHNYMKKDNTLVYMPSLRMVYPMKYQFQCTECKQIFYVSQSKIKDLDKFIHIHLNNSSFQEEDV